MTLYNSYEEFEQSEPAPTTIFQGEGFRVFFENEEWWQSVDDVDVDPLVDAQFPMELTPLDPETSEPEPEEEEVPEETPTIEGPYHRVFLSNGTTKLFREVAVLQSGVLVCRSAIDENGSPISVPRLTQISPLKWELSELYEG